MTSQHIISRRLTPHMGNTREPPVDSSSNLKSKDVLASDEDSQRNYNIFTVKDGEEIVLISDHDC